MEIITSMRRASEMGRWKKMATFPWDMVRLVLRSIPHSHDIIASELIDHPIIGKNPLNQH